VGSRKRIAVFLDGTWNNVSDNTNVWRLKSLCVADAASQVIYYSAGVGTRFGEKIRSGITGYGIDDEITDAYKWLIDSFEVGDELFIFGFSRGAYAARSLSGFISKCGLLTPGAPLSVKQLYDRYRRRTAKTIGDLLGNPGGSSDQSETSKVEDAWILRYCAAINIKFVGVWETVGSLGIPIWNSSTFNVSRYQFLDTHLRLANTFAFHALALDEHRASYKPTLWTRTVAHDAKGPPRERGLEEVEQRWFVGAHANIGGGCFNDILAQAPLKWLMDKAAALGLKFRSTISLDQFGLPPIADSYGSFGMGAYRILSRPYYRPIGSSPEVGTKFTTSTINETIDGSVFDRWRDDPNYRPPNLKVWAERVHVDCAAQKQSVLASDPNIAAPDPQPRRPLG
jgi:uncharacterized protein (DUF2235 family)